MSCLGGLYLTRHHLQGTRPLPQAPLCDLLPAGYLSSLKRTDARVRWADQSSPFSPAGSALELDDADGSFRPGLRRRLTGPPSDDERRTIEDEWELTTLRERAEDAVTRLAEAVAGTGAVDDELRQQLDQLNPPEEPKTAPKPRSNLANTAPANLPLAILKLMEAYITGLAWSDAKRDRALGVVKALCAELGHAERLAASESGSGTQLTRPSTIAIDTAPVASVAHLSRGAAVLAAVRRVWLGTGLDLCHRRVVPARTRSARWRSGRGVWRVG